MDNGRPVIKAFAFVYTPRSPPNFNNDRDEQSGRVGATSRHRLGVFPERAGRSMNYDCVPVDVVTPSPPIAISTRPIASLSNANPAKLIGQSPQPYISQGGLQNGLGGSSLGAFGLDLGPRKLEFNGFEDVNPQKRFKASPGQGGLDFECQVPSNSMLTFHTLQADGQDNLGQPRHKSEDRIGSIFNGATKSKNGSVKTSQSAPPKRQAKAKPQRDVERLEKKLRNEEETANGLRAQIEHLTGQLAAKDDVTQTLRSRIRELETENESWQNRSRLCNDVEVAKILRENEKLRGRCNKLEEKCQAAKELVKAYRIRRRQDHIEVESLKVVIEIQKYELEKCGKNGFVEQYGITAEAPPPTVTCNTTSDAQFNTEFVNANLAKCDGIAECISQECTRMKRQEPLDHEDVLDYGICSGANIPGAKIPKTQCDGKSMDEKM